jgi:hypothetical protein
VSERERVRVRAVLVHSSNALVASHGGQGKPLLADRAWPRLPMAAHGCPRLAMAVQGRPRRLLVKHPAHVSNRAFVNRDALPTLVDEPCL